MARLIFILVFFLAAFTFIKSPRQLPSATGAVTNIVDMVKAVRGKIVAVVSKASASTANAKAALPACQKISRMRISSASGVEHRDAETGQPCSL